MPIKNRDNRPSSVKRALAVSDRVFIRKATSRDRKEFLQRMLDSRKLHRSWVPTISTPEGFAEFLRRGRKANREQTLLCRIEDGAIMGVINLNEIIRGLTNSTFIGYYGFQPFDRQGYMTEGIDVMLKHAFRNLKLHRVEAGIQPNNVRSIALVNRLGFRYEGTAKRLIKIAGRWRDHQRWAILAEERAKRPRTKKRVRSR